jgi:hypothetical protein
MSPSRRADARPRLIVVVELEELPIVRIDAETFEDEQRLRAWLENDAVQIRVLDTVADALDALEAAA